MTIIFAILLFSLLIFVHELGHFAAAKASGVQVNEFSMFMGPTIYKKQVGETLYSLRCIPFGGYCAMEGEDQETDNPRSFQRAAWWKRLIILAAGSAMNFITGLLIMLIVFAPAQKFVVPVVSQFEEGCSLSAPGGLEIGDRILELDGEKIYVQSDFSVILSLNGGEIHDMVVERNGEKIALTGVRMEKKEFPNTDGTTSLRYGFSFDVEDATAFGRIRYAWNSAVDTVRSVRLSFKMLFTGKAGFSDVSGPVGIVNQMNDVANASASWLDALLNMLYFGGFIAINLAVMNLLPIPALDGGRILSLLLTVGIEKLTRKKLDPRYEGYIHAAGMVLLLGLMAVIMFKDIFAIFKG